MNSSLPKPPHGSGMENTLCSLLLIPSVIDPCQSIFIYFLKQPQPRPVVSKQQEEKSIFSL